MGVGRRAGCERLTEQGEAQPNHLDICSDDPITAASLTASCHHPLRRILVRDPYTILASPRSVPPPTVGSVTTASLQF